ncbi:MAG: phage tail assembly chaperone [Sphingorhabdus sp.]
MTFGETALRLSAICALQLRWRPDTFWNATPAELLCILRLTEGEDTAPPNPNEIQNLMSLFPDKAAGEQ